MKYLELAQVRGRTTNISLGRESGAKDAFSAEPLSVCTPKIGEVGVGDLACCETSRSFSSRGLLEPHYDSPLNSHNGIFVLKGGG